MRKPNSSLLLLHNFFSLWVLLLIATITTTFATDTIYSVTVKGTDCIHLAGHNTDIAIPAICGNTDSYPIERHPKIKIFGICINPGYEVETFPKTIPVPAGGAVTFSNVTGTVTVATILGISLNYPPIGATLSIPALGISPVVDVYSVNKLRFSGYQGPMAALVGVFIGQSSNKTIPNAIDFRQTGLGGAHFTSLQPELNQVFYIGNGLDQSNHRVTYHVPAEAQFVALGVVDTTMNKGHSGQYEDNDGQFRVGVTVTDPAPICQGLCQNNGSCSVGGLCQCTFGWEGAYCNISKCNNGLGCNALTSFCNSTSECECQPGWFGADCSARCPLAQYTVPKVTVTLDGSYFDVDVEGFALSFIDTQPTLNLSGDVRPFIPILGCTRFVGSYWGTNASNPCLGHLHYRYEFIDSVQECSGVVKNTTDPNAVTYTFPFQISSWTFSGSLPTSNDLDLYLLVQYYLPVRLVLPTVTSFTQSVEMWHAFTWAGLAAGVSTYDADESQASLGIIASMSSPYKFVDNYTCLSAVTTRPSAVPFAYLQPYKDTCDTGATGTCLHNFYLVVSAPYCQVEGDYVIQIPIECRSWMAGSCVMPQDPDDPTTTLKFIQIKVHLYQNDDCTVDSVVSSLSSALTFGQTVYNQNELVSGNITLTSDITIKAANLAEFSVCQGTSACTAANRKSLISSHVVTNTYGSPASFSFDDTSSAIRQKLSFRLVPSIFSPPPKNTKSPFYFEGTVNGINYETSKVNHLHHPRRTLEGHLIKVGARELHLASLSQLTRVVPRRILRREVIHIDALGLDQTLGTVFNADSATFSGVMNLQSTDSSSGAASLHSSLRSSLPFVMVVGFFVFFLTSALL